MRMVNVPDYFAELFVAGRLAAAGWNVYFPHRDEGFDFIIAKQVDATHQMIRPVQVKGKYPTQAKTDKTTYGYVGRLSQLHPSMVLAIPYFAVASSHIPCCVAYLPYSQIRRHSRGYRCQPACYKAGVPEPRREFRKFFDEPGIQLIESSEWSTMRGV